MLAPHDPVLTQRHGVVAAKRGDVDRAEALFVEVTRIVPQSPEPWRNLAVLYGLTGDTTKHAQAQAEADRLAVAPR